MNTTGILGVDVDCVDIHEILILVEKWTAGGLPRTIFYANAHSLNTAYRDYKFYKIITQADLVYADGSGVVWASEYLSGCKLVKITGADWIEDYCKFAEEKQLRTYLVAGKTGIAEKAAVNLLNRYPALKIDGVSDGYFRTKDEVTVLKEIEEFRPHVVMVGMGTPLQEAWIQKNRDRISSSVCWAVGALFDYVAGNERRVPSRLYKMNLEWLWRLLIDPRGKWKRYLIGNPLFVYRVLVQKKGSAG